MGLTDDIKAKADDAQAKVKAAASDAKDKAEEVAEKAKDAAQNAVDTVKDKANDIENKAHETKGYVKGKMDKYPPPLDGYESCSAHWSSSFGVSTHLRGSTIHGTMKKYKEKLCPSITPPTIPPSSRASKLS